MIRVRFHGRGGHGVKTASRILGSAAFGAGFQAQDSPIYGAERRGAPVLAFTRISEEPILERGVIESPEIIVIADETLVEDPAAGVLSGAEGASVVFVNASSSDRVVHRIEGPAKVVTFDVSERTRAALGDAHTLSVGLGAASARLTGIINLEHLLGATRDETEDLRIPAELVDVNVALARDIFEAVAAVPIRPHSVTPTGAVHPLAYDEPALATPSIFKPGNSELRQTGNWRIEEPVVHNDLCSRCKMCFVYCPDGAIALDDEGYPLIDYEHCKGCMICQHVCPVRGAISAKQEVRAW